MEETIILEKVKAGDAAAFSLLYDLYWLKVYNFARLYVTSSSVISEVVRSFGGLVFPSHSQYPINQEKKQRGWRMQYGH